MTVKHIAARFDREFSALASRVMELGGLVEAQTRMAAQALLACHPSGAQAVVNAEWRVDAVERDIDRDLPSAMGRRQAKATALRLLTAMARSLAANQAVAIGRMSRSCSTWRRWGRRRSFGLLFT